MLGAKLISAYRAGQRAFKSAFKKSVSQIETTWGKLMLCKTCLYFSSYRGPRDTNEKDAGQCRWRPPVVITEDGIGPEVIWPLVFEDDFCGQYKEKPTPETE